ncbi:MAG: sigma-54-dependent Fis family transcriptional regulator [Nostoc sp. DedQUE01]|nr:sigma-54-dependent Fis family transcriptional regulator [Nostoc sp. DedQUE11]MDZ8076202.1 sigma-54-dependent Fis family transcriptional regulator [Nostoc sp. DedQUE01]MDZ8078987.1 sigma-54-dependent Fis family transcriptional regulator [Nostoc sp. DcaGUA01]
MSSQTSNVLEAGRIYRSIGAIPPDLLRADIYRAWERSHLQGANPHTLQAESLSSLDTERLLEKHSYLINAVRPYFRILSQAAGRERHAVMLSNHEAILLDVIGDEQTIDGPEPFPLPGTLLSEAVAGANGIGTTLAEENYTEIVAAEHFIDGFYPFTCQGTPLRNDKGEIVGVFSISVRNPDAGQRLKEILLCASHGIEAEFLVTSLEKDVRHVLASNPDDYQPLENLRQDIIQAHQTTRLQLEIISRMVAVNTVDYAMQLLQQAEKSIQIFRRRAKVWRDLASLERGIPQVLILTDVVQDLVDLLSTEAAIRKVEVVMHFSEPVMIFADLKSLSRQLLSYFLYAFESANKGGIVEVELVTILHSELVQVSFHSIPGLNISQSDVNSYIFTLPIGKNGL